MKKSIAILLTFVILFTLSVSFADQARFLKEDGNKTYHSEHLLLHVGSRNCKVSGNYIKVRDGAGTNDVLGHLEQSDVFTLDYMNGSWAHITVIFSAKTSPDSYAGLSGWVDCNYIECPCSYDEYYYGPAHTTYSTGTILQDKTNLREDSAKNSVALTKVNKGDQVDILSEYTGKDGKLWCRVRFNQQVGFIRSDFLNVTATGISETGAVSTWHDTGTSGNTMGTDSLAVISAGYSWQELYRAFILNKEYERIGYPDYLPDGYDIITMTSSPDQLEYVGYDYDPIWFSLYDLDDDQTPELLIFNGMGYMAGNFCHVYTFQNQSMKYLGQLGRRELFLTYSNDRGFPGLVQTDGNMGFYTTDYWYIKDGEILVETIESISDHPDPEEAEYDRSGDDAIITQETENTALYNWYHSSSFSSLPHWEYDEIYEKGWDMFIASVYLSQRHASINNSESDTSGTDVVIAQNESANPDTSDSVLYASDGYYYIDNYNDEDFYSLIPVDVYCNREVYNANEPVTFSADILGGTPPFTVQWFVEESQTRDSPTPLDKYIESHPDYISSISYTTNQRHVEFVYTPPVESTTIFGCFGVTDSKGISSYSMNEDLVAVDTLSEWREIYPHVANPENESFPFVARTNKKNVNVRNGIGKENGKVCVLEAAGTTVKIIGKGYDSSGIKWYIVRLNIAQTGFIRNDLLTTD